MLSRYDFALKVAQVFDLDSKYIIPIDTPSLQQPALRLLKAGMICDRLSSSINWNLKNAIEGLNLIKQDNY